MTIITFVESRELLIKFFSPIVLLVFTICSARRFTESQYRALRFCAFSAICILLSRIQITHSLVNTLPSYLLGFLSVWIIYLSVVFILIRIPTDYYRINIKLSETETHLVYADVDLLDYNDCPSRNILWSLDLLANSRGIGWSHGSKNLERGGLPKGTELLCERIEHGRCVFLLRNFSLAVRDYVLLDICTGLANGDAFLSGSDISNPFLLSTFNRLTWFAYLPYRLWVAGIGIYSIIDFGSRIFALIAVSVGQEWLGTWGQHWNYPPLFGSICTIPERGLAGFWGNFWHPVFRYGLDAIAKSISQLRIAFIVSQTPLAEPDKPKSLITIVAPEVTRICVVFFLSGIMHAAGSCTLAARMPAPLTTRTFPHLTMLGFCLQPLGIILQRVLYRRWLTLEPHRERIIKFVVMVLFTFAWLLCTMPLIVADFAAGQLFKIEILPFSLRG